MTRKGIRLRLKQLSKEQKKQFKEYAKHVYEEILESYSETVRLNRLPGINDKWSFMPIKDTKYRLEIGIAIKNR